MLKKGQRVRMVQTNSYGTVSGEPYPSPVDGSERIPVKWDGTGMVNGWNSFWLRLAETSPEDDPDTLIQGELCRKKGKVEGKGNGLFVIAGGGFSKVILKR